MDSPLPDLASQEGAPDEAAVARLLFAAQASRSCRWHGLTRDACTALAAHAQVGLPTRVRGGRRPPEPGLTLCLSSSRALSLWTYREALTAAGLPLTDATPRTTHGHARTHAPPPAGAASGTRRGGHHASPPRRRRRRAVCRLAGGVHLHLLPSLLCRCSTARATRGACAGRCRALLPQPGLRGARTSDTRRVTSSPCAVRRAGQAAGGESSVVAVTGLLQHARP